MKVRVTNNNKRLVWDKNTCCSELLEDSGPGEVDPIVEGVQFKVVYNLPTVLHLQYILQGEIPGQLPCDLRLWWGGDGKCDKGNLGNRKETWKEAGKSRGSFQFCFLARITNCKDYMISQFYGQIVL